MDRLNRKMGVLDRIRQAEGDSFECDEKAILDEYGKQEENKSSLAIKMLSIFGGVLSSLSFLGFLAVGLYDSALGLLIFGIVSIISATWLNKMYDKLIIDTFSVSLYVIGIALLAFGLSQMDVNENTIAIIISLMSLSSLIITQNFILSFISVQAISCCFLFLISNYSYNLIHLYIAGIALILTFIFLNEAKIISFNKTFSRLYDPVRIGLVISFLFGLILVGKRDLIPISQNSIWLSSMALILILMYVVNKIIKINEIHGVKNKLMIYALSVLVLAPTLYSPAISGAILVILLSFLVNYRTGLAIGIISIIYFISQYYYDLNITLLVKSIILMGTGILFLVFYLFTSKKLSTND